MAEPVHNRTRIYCNSCKQETNHDLKGEHQTKWYDDESGFGEIIAYRLWICMVPIHWAAPAFSCQSPR